MISPEERAKRLAALQQELVDDFVRDLPARCAILQAAADSGLDRTTHGAPEPLLRAVHNLRGTAAATGFGEAAALVSRVETLFVMPSAAPDTISSVAGDLARCLPGLCGAGPDDHEARARLIRRLDELAVPSREPPPGYFT